MFLPDLEPGSSGVNLGASTMSNGCLEVSGIAKQVLIVRIY